MDVSFNREMPKTPQPNTKKEMEKENFSTQSQYFCTISQKNKFRLSFEFNHLLLKK